MRKKPLKLKVISESELLAAQRAKETHNKYKTSEDTAIMIAEQEDKIVPYF